MAKQGIIHDYDLHANLEPAARGQTCLVCGVEPVGYQWSDYSGEAMCTRCGAPYQLKWGTEAQKREGAYPYLRLKAEWVPVFREYFAETGRWTCLGWMMGPRPGLAEFYEWVEVHHPELCAAALAEPEGG